MLSSRLVRLARLHRLSPLEGIDPRAVALAFTARFTDEILSGAWTVLLPVFRQAFRLSLFRVGLLTQMTGWVALAVEPVTATMIDFTSRRRLLSLGAAALAASTLAMAAAPSYLWLLGGFALYGVGSGPLAHTGDVLVVEAFPAEPERAYARATLADTTGALLGPAFVAVAAAAHISWRVVLAVLSVWAASYALAAATATIPAPPRERPSPAGESARTVRRELLAGLRNAVASPATRRWLLVLLCFDVFEAGLVLKYVWLHETVGLGLALVAAWATLEQVVDLFALAWLDRRLAASAVAGRATPVRLLRIAAAVLIVLPAAWAAVPGIGGKIAVGIPLAFVHALVWPLAKSQSLVSAPDSAGATQAVTTLFPLVPLALLQAGFSQLVGMGPAMAVTSGCGAAAMLLACGAAR